jgi:hypothetical protein
MSSFLRYIYRKYISWEIQEEGEKCTIQVLYLVDYGWDNTPEKYIIEIPLKYVESIKRYSYFEVSYCGRPKCDHNDCSEIFKHKRLARALLNLDTYDDSNVMKEKFKYFKRSTLGKSDYYLTIFLLDIRH